MKYFQLSAPLPLLLNNELRKISISLPNLQPDSSFYLVLKLFSLTESSVLLDIEEQLQYMGQSPLRLSLETVKCLKMSNQKSQLYINPRKTLELEALLKNLDRVLSPLKLDFIRRKELPYIDLGESQTASPNQLAFFLEAAHYYSFSSFELNEICLLERKVTPKHIVYLEHARFSLRAEPNL